MNDSRAFVITGSVEHYISMSVLTNTPFFHQNSLVVFDPHFNCTWANFKPYYPIYSGVTTEADIAIRRKMCVYDRQDDLYVTGSILSDGRWAECDQLTDLWNRFVAPFAQHQPKFEQYYFDIGGNIGSWIMQMLMTTSAKIVAFEPHPMNLQLLTSTLMKLENHVRERITLFPFALGSESFESTIIAAKNNRGNSIVGGKKIQDHRSQQFTEPIQIFVESLDSILELRSSGTVGFTIPVMKIDIQGFECFAVDGMNKTLQNVISLCTEVDDMFLRGQGCSKEEYMKKLNHAGLYEQLEPGKGRKVVTSSFIRTAPGMQNKLTQ